VAYQVVGDGPFDVVFIPAWDTNVDAMWDEPTLARFLRRLGTFSRLLCFDKRGTGVSDRCRWLHYRRWSNGTTMCGR